MIAWVGRGRQFKSADPDHSFCHRVSRLQRPYGTVTVMLSGAGFVTVPVPAGVTVSVYVCAVAVFVVEEEPPPPQAISKPASEIASAVSSTAIARFRRKPNGAPSNTAQSMTAPPPFHRDGACFAALVVAEMVNVLVPLAPLVSVTEGALAPTNVDEQVATKVTVPA